MSFVRQHLQQIARSIYMNIPKKFGLVNTNIMDSYQRFHDAAIDFYRQHDLRRIQNPNEEARFPLLKKFMNLLTMAMNDGGTYKKAYNDDVLPTLNELIKPKLIKEDKKSEDSYAEPAKLTNNVENADVIQQTVHIGNTRPKENKRPATFSDRAVIEYDNRLRNYTAPEKIFRRFATYCLASEMGTEIVMTPSDFLSSIYPGKNKSSWVDLNRFHRVDPKEIEYLDFSLAEDSVFLKLGLNGLVSYPDYLFLMTLLTTSSRYFRIAFKMFDVTGRGILTAEEFQCVTALARQSATFAATGQDFCRRNITNNMLRYFFGDNLKRKLSIDDFLAFQRNLKLEIITLEFESKPRNDSGLISEGDFAELLIAYADYGATQKDEKIQRVRKHFKRSQRGMSLEDYFNFWDLLYHLPDIETALSFYHSVGASISKDILLHVANAVAKVDLSQRVLDIAFILFDENEDHSSNSEFVDVMKRRLNRSGMEWKHGTNFKKVMAALRKCALERRSYDF